MVLYYSTHAYGIKNTHAYGIILYQVSYYVLVVHISVYARILVC